MNVADIADKVIEGPIVTSFTKLGYHARRKLDDWTPLDRYDLTDHVVLLTGATSGLGKCAAAQLGRLGASVIVVGRSADRNQDVVDELTELTGNDGYRQIACDTGDYEQVRDLAAQVLTDFPRLDVLVHNAGALSPERQEAPDGTEQTVASQVVGPFLLTSLLLDRLTESAPSRVITMSSGGMYAAGLTVSKLEMPPDDYNGTDQYARAKRAQVTLNEMWAERCGGRGVSFQAMHPGWADTPGVEAALPGFRKVMGPLLRDADQGADTLVWLAADPEPLEHNGSFWLDRRIRSIHKLPTTSRTDTPERREQLWDWVVERSGADLG
jgi:dehydrogenase/reductase SDR family protein 12